MSDELTIQPQVQRVSTMPYALGGAALGAGAGWATSAAINHSKKGTPKTAAELIKEANEKDKVELTSKQNAVEEAQKKLDEASKAVFDGKEKEELETAKENLKKELDRLTETKTSEKPFKTVTWDKAKIDLTQIDDVIVRTKDDDKPKRFGKKDGVVNRSKVIDEYNKLVGDYNDAISNFEKGAGAKDIKKLEDQKAILKQYFKDVEGACAGLSVDDYAKTFSTESISYSDTTGARASWSPHTREFVRADETAEKIFPKLTDPKKLTLEQAESFAKLIEKPKDRPADYVHQVEFKVPVSEGSIKTKTVKYAFSKDMFDDFAKQENEKLASTRAELRNALLGRAADYLDLPKEASGANEALNFQNKWVTNIDDKLTKNIGSNYVDSSKHVKIADLIKEVGLDPDGNINTTAYDNDIKKLKEADKSATKLPSLKKNHADRYKGCSNVGEALKWAENRKQIIEQYAEDHKTWVNDLKSVRYEYEPITELEDKIKSAREANEEIAKAKQALFDQFPSLAEGTNAKIGLTEAEAKEKESYKKLAKIVEEKQNAYDKKVAEKGKVDEGAKKAAQEALEKAKGDLDSLVNKLNEATKGLSGKMKAAIIGGAAIVAGGIGAMVANSKNKAAEEAYERQIIA